MKNKFIGLILVVGLLLVYPTWRYFSNANIFAKALINHASALGEWSYRSINSSFDGKLTISGLTFTPNNYKQHFEIESVTISTSPMFLLKSNASKLGFLLPESLVISVNTAVLSKNSSSIQDALREDSMWMLMAGFAGSFGCNRDSYLSFDKNTWKDILSEDQVFNLDLYYAREENGSMDVDLTLDAENLFSSTWSSNLRSSYNDDQVIFDELIIDKLYYSYLDNGFNLQRNNACMKNYKSSFAAYRLSSAEHVQKYLRSHFAKEMPSVLISWYQRMLAPEIEFNAIITLDERRYLSDIYKIDQKELYENSMVEVATSANDYLPITLKEIDFTQVDSEQLQKENQERKKREEQARLEKLKLKKERRKPKIFTTRGNRKVRKVALNKLSTVINRKIRVKTLRGRPITGYLRGVKDGLISIETIFKTGRAEISIEIERIASVELMK
ncbi:MAG TPA: hypothetical protein ENJ41_03865 [Oceanospirillales bacterium]|nr:hypothetical protein [Oceanospirillales bacterium]